MIRLGRDVLVLCLHCREHLTAQRIHVPTCQDHPVHLAGRELEQHAGPYAVAEVRRFPTLKRRR